MSELSNYMEVAVRDVMDTVLADMDVCTCEECRLDIMAIALNNLKPKYVVTKRGQLYTKVHMLESQYAIDIISAVTRAAETVRLSPRHD